MNTASRTDILAYKDMHNDIWVYGPDGLLHSYETRAMEARVVERKWGPLTPIYNIKEKSSTYDISVTNITSTLEKCIGWIAENDGNNATTDPSDPQHIRAECGKEIQTMIFKNISSQHS